MKNETKARAAAKAITNFFVFFLLVAFVITCCLMLFTSLLQVAVGRDFTESEISTAAKATMINVILISLLFAGVDTLRRRLTVKSPAKKIIDATSRMIEGDFTVRIDPVSNYLSDEIFGEIIESINKMAEELSGVETLRSDFISNVSHEMKTPLAVIKNYATLLSSPDLDSEKRIEYATAISDASRRLADMVTNVLKLSSLENQKIFPAADPYNLGEQLCESLLAYESVWERKNISIETDIEEGIIILADAELLSLVWNNLFSNAFKFTDEGGTVSVSLRADGSFATVRISDTGCGISQEVGAHIFEKFYQGDLSRATEGNGLGLALVKRVIDITEGEIGVESTAGRGSTFTVKIRRAHSGSKKTL
jgi:signal transduction histidine kinase